MKSAGGAVSSSVFPPTALLPCSVTMIDRVGTIRSNRVSWRQRTSIAQTGYRTGHAVARAARTLFRRLTGSAIPCILPGTSHGRQERNRYDSRRKAPRRGRTSCRSRCRTRRPSRRCRVTTTTSWCGRRTAGESRSGFSPSTRRSAKKWSDSHGSGRMRKHKHRTMRTAGACRVGAAVLAVAAAACAPPPEAPAASDPPATAPQPAGNPLRQAFFGDLHVHSSWSLGRLPAGRRPRPSLAGPTASGAASGSPRRTAGSTSCARPWISWP